MMQAGRWGIVVATALGLAGCQTVAANMQPSPEHPGTRITVKNPDPTKWAAAAPTALTRAARIQSWTCRPLACSGQAFVAAQFVTSPTRNPDHKALEKAAKLLTTQVKAQDMMVEAASEGDEHVTPLSSRVTQVRDFPAIVAESKRATRGKASFTMRGDLFIGFTQVKIAATAPEREEAKRYFDSFVAAMDILDFAPPAPGAPPPEAAPAPTALDGDTAAATPPGQ